MKLVGVIALLSAIAPAALGTPTPAGDATNAKKFKIMTKSISGNMWDGYFMNSYHTGAGQSAPFFSKHSSLSFQFNGTKLFTTIDGNLPLYLAFGQVEDLAAEWGSMTLNTPSRKQLAMEGFKIDDNGHLINSESQWYGWRACKWVHEVPELYWDAFSITYVPCNCEKIYLVPVYD